MNIDDERMLLECVLADVAARLPLSHVEIVIPSPNPKMTNGPSRACTDGASGEIGYVLASTRSGKTATRSALSETTGMCHKVFFPLHISSTCKQDEGGLNAVWIRRARLSLAHHGDLPVSGVGSANSTLVEFVVFVDDGGNTSYYEIKMLP